MWVLRLLVLLLLWVALAALPPTLLPTIAPRARLPIGLALPRVVVPGGAAMRQRRRLRRRHIKHVVWQGGRGVFQLARRPRWRP